MTTTKQYGKSLDYTLPEHERTLAAAHKHMMLNWNDPSAHEAWVAAYYAERNAHPQAMCPACGCEIPDYMLRDTNECEYCEGDEHISLQDTIAPDPSPSAPTPDDDVEWSGTISYTFTCEDCGGEFPQGNLRYTNCEGVMRYFHLCDDCNALWDDPNYVAFSHDDDDDEFAEWTVCPRCETQVALDDLQPGSLLCDDCLEPAQEDSAYCNECEINRYDGPTPEDDNSWSNRGGGSYRAHDQGANDTNASLDRELHQRLRRLDRLIDTWGSEWGMEQESAILNDIARRRKAIADRQQEADIATYQRMNDGYRKQQFLARISAAALALFLALGVVSTSAAETIQGRERTYPLIGTPAYSDSCLITEEYEDGAFAWCAEDGATYFWDADGQPYANIAHVPLRQPGWYVVK